MTPGSNGFESVGKQRIQKNRFEESKEYEKKNLSSLVTKPQISIHFIKIDITVLINAINTDIKIIQWVESYLWCFLLLNSLMNPFLIKSE